MLGRCRVLVAEDEALVACALAAAVRDADGEVIGPLLSVKEALATMAKDDVQAAILDVTLTDRDTTPIAVILLEEGKVVLFHTASEVPAEITERFGDVVVCPKPTGSEQVVRTLASMLDGGA